MYGNGKKTTTTNLELNFWNSPFHCTSLFCLLSCSGRWFFISLFALEQERARGYSDNTKDRVKFMWGKLRSAGNSLWFISSQQHDFLASFIFWLNRKFDPLLNHRGETEKKQKMRKEVSRNLKLPTSDSLCRCQWFTFARLFISVELKKAYESCELFVICNWLFILNSFLMIATFADPRSRDILTPPSR